MNPVKVNEAPGFIVNRMLIPMVNEAVFTLAEGVATAEDIDNAMKDGAGHPMGPLHLADLIGLDVCLFVMEILYNEFADSKYRPCPLLTKMVRSQKELCAQNRALIIDTINECTIMKIKEIEEEIRKYE